MGEIPVLLGDITFFWGANDLVAPPSDLLMAAEASKLHWSRGLFDLGFAPGLFDQHAQLTTGDAYSSCKKNL
jgi:hypothetical protein